MNTDIAGDKKIFRNRGLIGHFIRESGAEVGDIVVLEQLATYEFRLHLQKPDGRRVSGSPSTTKAVLNVESTVQEYAPSKGVVPSFGTRQGVHADGIHSLYVAVFKGDGARLLGSGESLGEGMLLVKVGMSNDTGRRCSELNSGFPPSAHNKWEMEWQFEFPDGRSAFNAETVLKRELDRVATSLGGEFFLGNGIVIREAFDRISGGGR